MWTIRYIFIAAVLWLAALAGFAFAQQPRTTTQAKLALTGSFQLLLPAPSPSPRSGCTIQNQGANTMFVFFGGATAPPDNTTSFKLAVNQSINCEIGGALVAVDPVWINGTAADVVVYSVQ